MKYLSFLKNTKHFIVLFLHFYVCVYVQKIVKLRVIFDYLYTILFSRLVIIIILKSINIIRTPIEDIL